MVYSLERFLRYLLEKDGVLIQARVPVWLYEEMVAEKRRKKMSWREFLNYLWHSYKVCKYTPLNRGEK